MLRFCFFLAVPAQLFAFEFFKTADNEPCHWDLATLPEGTIHWTLSDDAPEIAHDSMAFATLNWTVASAGALKFSEGDGGIKVIWADPNIDAAVPAQAVLAVNRSTITSAIISFNTQSFRWMRGNQPSGTVDSRRELDLDAIMLHELGHALGLHHSDENPAALIGAINGQDMPTMNSVVYPSARSLHLDDIAGIRKLYGIDAPLPQMLVEASPAVGRAPLRVALFQSGGDSETQWNLGNGSLTSGEQAKARYRAPGFYTVTAESNGMTASVIIEVTKRGRKSARSKRR